MSCTSGFPTFRLLDAFAGWDPGDQPYDAPQNLVGFSDPAGIRLAQLNPGEINPGDLIHYLSPPRLARGCGSCDWYLITPAPPESRLLHRDPCTGKWVPVWDEHCVPNNLLHPIAVAAWRHRIAVSDLGANVVYVWSAGGARVAARINISCPGPLAFTTRGELLVAAHEGNVWILKRFGPAGEFRGRLTHLPAGKIDRLGVSSDCAIWVIVENGGVLEIWRRANDEHAFSIATINALQEAFKPTGLTASSDRGFCLEQFNKNKAPVVCCFSWYGRPLCAGEISPAPPTKLYERGQLLTKAIDSGIPRCRWHRVVLDAEVPSGTTLEVAVSTSEDPKPTPQGNSSEERGWENFNAGVPHPLDWQTAPPGALDALIQQQPPGRYLFVRLRLIGNGSSTPIVHRVRLEFPRKTSLDLLPPVYRENPDTEDFTERFLSLFDATISDLDAAIERYPALLDPDGVPTEVLPWLGTFVDVAFDQSWTVQRRRMILRAVPELYKMRGTVEGLKKAIQLVFGVDPAIQEIAAERMWGAVANTARPNDLKTSSRLGEVRLFGKASARFRLGSSTLSHTPLRSFGNPDRDPLNAGAYRFRVLVPPASDQSAFWRERLTRLIDSQKPAHTIASLRVGGDGFVIGAWTAVGVDTIFNRLPPPILGNNLRLNRMSVLWQGPGGPRSGMVAGQNAIVGIKTVME